MYIRPYTVSQIGLILFAGFLWLYLYRGARSPSVPLHPATRGIMEALVWGMALFGLGTIVGVMENPRVDLLWYFVQPFGILFFAVLARTFYTLPPSLPPVWPGETRWAPRIMQILALVDMVYSIYRVGVLGQNGTIPPRPWSTRLGMLLAGTWLLVILVRKGRQAARSAQPESPNFLGWLIADKGPTSAFFRGFLAMAVCALGIGVLFSLYSQGDPPIGVLLLSDLIGLTSLAWAAYIYLRHQLIPLSLEARVIGSALFLFLSLVLVLGWTVAYAFLQSQAPGIPMSQVIGAHMAPTLPVAPEYRPLLAQLSNLMGVLVLFEVVGAVLFVWGFTLFYRGTIAARLDTLAHGLQQMGMHNLSLRLPVAAATWQDELSQIESAFNNMAGALERTDHRLQAYQAHLESLVEERTQALQEEIALRHTWELQQAVQTERNRIGRETHDGILQSILGVRLRLSRAKRLSHQAPEAIEAELLHLADELTRTRTDLRHLIHGLTQDILEEGLISLLQAAIARYEASYGIPIRSHVAYQPGSLTLDQELNLLRMVQEALSNACRHSGAGEIQVRIQEKVGGDGRRALHVQVTDDGRGFHANAPTLGGFGLQNLRARAEELGATLQIASAPGSGTAITLCIPWPGSLDTKPGE